MNPNTSSCTEKVEWNWGHCDDSETMYSVVVPANLLLAVLETEEETEEPRKAGESRLSLSVFTVPASSHRLNPKVLRKKCLEGDKRINCVYSDPTFRVQPSESSYPFPAIDIENKASFDIGRTFFIRARDDSNTDWGDSRLDLCTFNSTKLFIFDPNTFRSGNPLPQTQLVSRQSLRITSRNGISMGDTVLPSTEEVWYTWMVITSDTRRRMSTYLKRDGTLAIYKSSVKGNENLVMTTTVPDSSTVERSRNQGPLSNAIKSYIPTGDGKCAVGVLAYYHDRHCEETVIEVEDHKTFCCLMTSRNDEGEKCLKALLEGEEFFERLSTSLNTMERNRRLVKMMIEREKEMED